MDIIEPTVAETIRDFKYRLSDLPRLTDGSFYRADFSGFDLDLGIIEFNNNDIRALDAIAKKENEMRLYREKSEKLIPKVFNQKIMQILKENKGKHISPNELIALMYTITNFVYFRDIKLDEETKKALLEQLSIEGYDDSNLKNFLVNLPDYPMVEVSIPEYVLDNNKAHAYLIENFMHQLREGEIVGRNVHYIQKYAEKLFGSKMKNYASSYCHKITGEMRKEIEKAIEEERTQEAQETTEVFRAATKETTGKNLKDLDELLERLRRRCQKKGNTQGADTGNTQGDGNR